MDVVLTETREILYLPHRFRFGEPRVQKVLGPPPPASTKAVSKSMKANVAKDTKPETTLRSALYAVGIKGYRLHKKGIPGRPDIVFSKSKLAVFVNGCFWHSCPVCRLPIPKTHRDFWTKKFKLNVERDKRKVKELESAGWCVLTVWEHEVRENLPRCVERVRRTLLESSKPSYPYR
jgi:DNA mismatch endonuclease (patch repair protein)